MLLRNILFTEQLLLCYDASAQVEGVKKIFRFCDFSRKFKTQTQRTKVPTISCWMFLSVSEAEKPKLENEPKKQFEIHPAANLIITY